MIKLRKCISSKKNDKYYISISYKPVKEEYIDNGLYQTIDLGITKIVTAINSNARFLEVNNLRPDKYWNPRIDEITSRRDHCKKYSRKWHKLNKRKKWMQRKSSNQSKDFQHKLSRQIVDKTRANTIIVGDLNVKSMGKYRIKGLKPQHTKHRHT